MNLARTIFLTQNVSPDMAKMFIKRLTDLDRESNEPILVVISSYGGCCRSMLGMRDAMKRARSPIGTLAVGMAMSAGCYLLAAGTPGRRAVSANCQVMIHGPNGTAPLDVPGLGGMKYYYDIIHDHIGKDIGASKEEITALVDRDKYFFAEEAIQLGFADHIVG